MSFLLYVPILLSVSFSFLLHVFKKYIHLLSLYLAAIYNTILYALHYSLLSKHIGLIKDIDKDIESLIPCTKDSDFQSIDINDEIDDDEKITKDEDEDYSWNRTKLAEDRGNFPPPISSLNELGQPSFIFVPIRKNGRMQLNKIRIRRPEILHATREDGRLRLFLIPDHNVEEDIEEKKKEEEEEKEKQELVDDDDDDVNEKEKEQFIVESIKEYEEDKEEVQEICSYDHKNICVEGLKLPSESFMKYYEVLNHIVHHHKALGRYYHLPMYGLSTA
ncbi:protein FANTASTIC FOUR 3-like [Vigna angularis]|uniref:protein FANTASTIC FOUR 3-like n=1 Tax=Phaseolus angularis TaxID=3914 RepID=UPI0022B59045|nr:protein FANTASTIC FOUR 3-like [Vigna angularis]